MTIKLYEQEGYQTTFHAHVISCVKKNELYDIIFWIKPFSFLKKVDKHVTKER